MNKKGTRDNAYNWNVVVVRALNTGDLAQDTTIFTGVATSVVMAFGVIVIFLSFNFPSKAVR